MLFLVAAVAGAINSVAAGGTLLTFPALLGVGGLAAITANATSTVALWPGQLSSLWAYRKELGASRQAVTLLAVPSFLGGLIGAHLLLGTSNETFRTLVPYLILMATLLFMAQEPLTQWQRRRTDTALSRSAGSAASTSQEPAGVWSFGRCAAVVLVQLLVAVYGGYFGAGIGILMLAELGFLGFTNIHRMNALKNINAMCINSVASALFISHGLVEWRLTSLVGAGAIVGGYVGADTARRIGQKNVRGIIVLIGLSLTISLLLPASPGPHGPLAQHAGHAGHSGHTSQPGQDRQAATHDQLRVAVQEICPVSDRKLGSMGAPIKAKIGQEEMFLCCQGCLHGKVNTDHWATIHANIAKAQAKCPVMDKSLPENPRWTIVEGQIVYICCPPCAKEIEADATTYLAKVDALYAASLKAPQTSR